MKTTIQDISALLVAKLQGLLKDNGDGLLGDVFDYGDGDFKKYPVAVVLPTGGSTGSVLDTHRIERTFNFQITFYQEQTKAGKDKSDANNIMKQAMDKVLVSFDQDIDLGGEVSRVRVVKMEFNFKVSAGTFIFATLQAECVVLVPDHQ